MTSVRSNSVDAVYQHSYYSQQYYSLHHFRRLFFCCLFICLLMALFSPKVFSACVNGIYEDALRDSGTEYNNQNGSLLWTTDWIETDPSGGGSVSGKVYRTENTIYMTRAGMASGNVAVRRGIDVTDVASLKIHFPYLSDLTSASDVAYFEMSYDGGSTWNTVGSYAGATGSDVWAEIELDVVPPVSTSNAFFRVNLPSQFNGFLEKVQFAYFKVLVTCQAQTGSGALSAANTFEVGQATLNNTSVDTNWVTVNLNQSYSTPPRVFAFASDQGDTDDPVDIRIKNVTTNSFQVAQFEPPGSNGRHSGFVVDYFVFEEGIHTLPGGTQIEVGSVNTNRFATRERTGQSFEYVNLSSTFPSRPNIIAAIQTVNNQAALTPGSSAIPWMTVAIEHVTTTGFNTSLDFSETTSGSITVDETVAYLAVLPGVSETFTDSTGTAITFESLAHDKITNPLVSWDDGGCTFLNFTQSYSSPPLVMGNVNSRLHGDGGWLRRCSLNTSQVGIVMDEDEQREPDRIIKPLNRAAVIAFSNPAEMSGSPVEIMQLRFEDMLWNGSTDEVRDHSGGQNHLTTMNGPRMSSASPALAGSPGSCQYAEFDGVDDWMERPVVANDGLMQGMYSVAFWMKLDAGFTSANQISIASRTLSDQSRNDWWIGNLVGSDYLRVGHDEWSRALDGTNVDTGISLTSVAGNWHHIVLTFNGSEIEAYLDGALISTTPFTRPTSSNDGYFYVGRDRILGDYFPGDLDEFYVYRGVLSPAEISSLMTSTHPCTLSCNSIETIPFSFATDWDTSTGAVDIDEIGTISQTFTNSNGYQYDVTITRNSHYSGAVDPIVDGIRTSRIQKGDFSLNLTETSTGAPLVVSGFDFYMSDFETNTRGEVIQSFQYTNAEGNSIESAPTWDDWVDINGNPVGAGFLSVNGSGELQSSYAFNGGMADSNKYARFNASNIPLSGFSMVESQFNTVDGILEFGAKANNISACFVSPPWALDHFEITTITGTGSTCAGTEIKITACADAATPCTPIPNYMGQIDLSTTSLHGSWVAGSTLTPNGSLTDSTADDGFAAYQFDISDQGVVYLTLNNSHADDLEVVVGDSVAMIAGTSPTLTFRDNAFVITPSVLQLPAGRDVLVTAEVWKNDGASCGIATEYHGVMNLKSWVSRTAALPTGGAPVLDGVSLPDSQPAGNNVALNFVNGVATSVLSTSDVGQYALNYLDDTSGFAQDLSGIRSIGGFSSDLTLMPFGFYVHNNDDVDAASSSASNASGSVFKAAGDDFTTTIRAVAWQAADDGNGDGLPDVGSNLSDNPVLVSFGQESPVESVDVTHALFKPVGGQTGFLIGGNNLSGFVNGERQVNLQYSEVGIIDLSVALSDNSYLGFGDVTGTINQVGRFIPAEFVLIAPSVTDACTGSTHYSYMGEDFSIDFDFEAVNRGGIRTENYDGSFEKFTVNNSTDFLVRGIQTSPHIDLTGRLTEDSWIGNFSQGQGDVSATYRFNRLASADGPYTIEYSIALTDSDGVTLDSFNVDADNNSIMDHRSLGNSLQRYGRFIVENSFGSELSDVLMNVRSEYYEALGTNAGFVRNNDDVCTAIFVSDVSFSNFTDNLSSLETSASINGWSNGGGGVLLSAPGVGNSGGATVTVDVPAWLEFDYKGLGVSDPTGQVAFGIHNNNKNNMIYLREVIR